MPRSRIRLVWTIPVALAAACQATPSAALQLVAQEEIALAGGLFLAEPDLGCAAPDLSGVVHCSGGPASDPLLLPEFQLDAWDIVSGPGARIDATFRITDLGQPKPNVAGVTLFEDAAPITTPVMLTLTASIEVTDANGDGAASVLPYPTSGCGCDPLLVLGGCQYPPVSLAIAPPVVATAFGTASTQATLTTPLADPGWLGLQLSFAGDISSGDSALVHVSISVVPVPEPGSGLLMAAALLAIGTLRRAPASPGPGR